jgi:hypothetical protein
MIRFLIQLFTRFIGWVSSRNSTNAVGDTEPLARFIFSAEHFAATKSLVKPKAFLPDKNGETSVFRIQGLDQEQTWAIGNGIRDERAKAFGRLLASSVRRQSLRTVPATEDHPLHAVIVDWPQEKDKRLMIATLLSKDTSLLVQT